MNLGLSVVVCTHDRAANLAKVLDALVVQDLSPDRFEVVVVDNASTDRTSTLCQEHVIVQSSISRFEYVYESRLGLSVARNTGVSVSHGAVVAFLDDDAIPDPQWASSLMAVFDDAAVGAAGGTVDLAYEGERPEWLTGDLELYLTRVDHGRNPRVLDLSCEWVAGANIAFRREILANHPFDVSLGRKGTSLRSGEETELCIRIAEQGWNTWWVPAARVVHQIPESRVTKKYLRRRALAGGYSAVLSRCRNLTGGGSAGDLVQGLKTVVVGCARSMSFWQGSGYRAEGSVLANAGMGAVIGSLAVGFARASALWTRSKIAR